MTVRRDRSMHAGALWRRAWARPGGRWPWARWGLTLLLPVSVLLWLLSITLAPGDPDLKRIVVQSHATSDRIEGARVVVGDVPFVTDVHGEILLSKVPNDTQVSVSASGHESAIVVVREDDDLVIALHAVLVLGGLSDIVSGEPISDADIEIIDVHGVEVASSRTDDSGTFVFKFIPEDAELVVRHDVYGMYRQGIGARRTLMIQLQPPDVRGRVVDASGDAVPNAVIVGPQFEIRADQDGRFLLHGVGQGTKVEVESGSGGAQVEVRGVDLGDIVVSMTPGTPEATSKPGERR